VSLDINLNILDRYFRKRNSGGTIVRVWQFWDKKFDEEISDRCDMDKHTKGPRFIHLVDSDDGGTGGVQNGIGPSINMPGQSLRSAIIDVRIETEIGSAAEVEQVPSHENARVRPELDISKSDTFALLELGFVPRSNFLRIDRSAEDVRLVLRIGDPTCLCGIKDRVTPRLDIERESVGVYVSSGGLETPVVVFVEIDVVEEDEDFGGGEERALKDDSHGLSGLGIRDQIADVLAGQELQVGRSKIERVNSATVKSSVGPRCDVVDTRSLGDVLNRRFDTDVGAFVYIELTDPMGKTRRGDEWTGEF